MPSLRVPRTWLLAAAVSAASVGLFYEPAIGQTPAGAVAWTPGETANVKLVEAFVKGFEAMTPDADQLTAMLSDDVVLSFSDTRPPLVGRDAALASIHGMLPPKRRYKMDIVGQTFAKNRVVVESRTDYTYRPDGSLSPPRSVVDIFVVEGGKIKSWKEYAN